jgi:hypothetical protein
LVDRSFLNKKQLGMLTRQAAIRLPQRAEDFLKTIAMAGG